MEADWPGQGNPLPFQVDGERGKLCSATVESRTVCCDSARLGFLLQNGGGAGVVGRMTIGDGYWRVADYTMMSGAGSQ